MWIPNPFFMEESHFYLFTCPCSRQRRENTAAHRRNESPGQFLTDVLSEGPGMWTLIAPEDYSSGLRAPLGKLDSAREAGARELPAGMATKQLFPK